MSEDSFEDFMKKTKEFMESVDKNAFLTKTPEEIHKEVSEAISFCGSMLLKQAKAICGDNIEFVESPLTRFFIGQLAVLYIQQAAMAGVNLKEYVSRLGDSFEKGIRQEEVDRLLEELNESFEDPLDDDFPLDGPDNPYDEE